MPDRREHTAIRLSPGALARVRTLADDETEGNVSAMLRKLLSEALLARDKADLAKRPGR